MKQYASAEKPAMKVACGTGSAPDAGEGCDSQSRARQTHCTVGAVAAHVTEAK